MKFQNLIGMLGRKREVKNDIFKHVSKPYRYARKKSTVMKITENLYVSKPYRYARKYL